MSTKMIKFTNRDEVFEKMEKLKQELEKKFKSNIKTNTDLIEYLVEDKLNQLNNI